MNFSSRTVFSRRNFMVASALLAALRSPANASEIGPLNGTERRKKAFKIRAQSAQVQLQAPFPPYPQPSNSDETTIPSLVGNFSKGLPHNDLGEVDQTAYQAFLTALQTGKPSDFALIPIGGTRKLVNPQGGLAFDLQGDDGHRLVMPPAPSFSSAEQAGEIVENYWMALTRDIPFTEYATNPLIQQAAADLSQLSNFKGAKVNGQVTPGTLFRGLTQGDLVGPLVSQFLLRPAPFGTQYLDQRQRPPVAGLNYITNYDEWLRIQRGILPSQPFVTDPNRRYLINVRDVGERAHVDVLLAAYLNACQILISPPNSDPLISGLGAPLNDNPYATVTNQIGFVTFGIPYINQLVVEVTTRVLKAMWFHKWYVHRRARPEAFAGAIHNHMTGAVSYPIHPDVLDSDALAQVFSQYGTYLLPMGYPEGSPLHPSYGAGHAVAGGACVTVLKAFFEESYVIPNPQVPNPSDPSQLIPYVGPPLTVGGELEKLVSNIALGRNMGGIHYRSDAVNSLKLGEDIAISLLRDQRACYNEVFNGFTFTKFDGTLVTV